MVTVAHLLHNSSGLRDMLEIMRQGGVDLGTPITTQNLLDGIYRQRTLNFAPGSRFMYSNTNFLLLGLIVERLAGETLGKFLERRIFRPLGMIHTRLTPSPFEPAPGLATGYLPADGGFRRAAHAFPVGGEGGLVSCVTDLALWDSNFTTGTVGGTVLGEALATQVAFTGGAMNLYARGLRIDTWRGLRTVSHGGLWPGFRTEFLRVPERDCAVIAITNTGAADPADLAHRVLDVLLEGQVMHPVPNLPPPNRLQPLVGRWIDPAAGLSMEISIERDGRLAVNAGGATVHPTLAPDGRLTVTHGTILLAIRTLDDGTLEIEHDAGHRAHWRRAAPDAMLPADLDGTYESAEMASRWVIAAGVAGVIGEAGVSGEAGVNSEAGVTGEAGATAEVEGPVRKGALWALEAVEGDLFRVLVPGILARAWFDVTLTRSAGRPNGLIVATNRLREVAYSRIS